MQLEPGARLQGVDLSEVDFGTVDLAGAVFEACTLYDSNISGATFQDAKFTKCRIIRSRFAKADLREAVFEDCSFADDQGHTGVQFAFSRLEQARFLRCDMSFAKFERSDLYAVDMETCNLRGAVFKQADFAKAFGAKVIKTAGALRGCNLELADLSEVRMPTCDLSNSRLREAVLFDANFESADLRSCDLTKAQTAGARFARADLRGADLTGLNLRELATYQDVMISADQSHHLLTVMGVDVCA